jgi:hypothetical protein
LVEHDVLPEVSVAAYARRMKVAVVALVLASGCLFEDNETNPDYSLPTFPATLMVEEGGTKTFYVGLTNGPESGASGAFYTDGQYCPAGLRLRFEPCTFNLSSRETYPAMVTAIATTDGDLENEMYSVEVYLLGEISEAGHKMMVTVVDNGM